MRRTANGADAAASIRTEKLSGRITATRGTLSACGRDRQQRLSWQPGRHRNITALEIHFAKFYSAHHDA